MSSEEEFAKRLKQIKDEIDAGRCDEEEGHIVMDDILCEYLTRLGYGAGVEIFQNTRKHYG